MLPNQLLNNKNAKMIYEEQYFASGISGQVVQGKRYSRSVCKYDNLGRLVETNWHYDDGSLFNTESLKYSENGNLAEKICSHFPPNSFTRKYIYKYQPDGEIIVYDVYSFDNRFLFKNIYDNSGKLRQNYSYDSQGKLSSNEIHKYNEKGNKIESISYNSRNNMTTRMEYEYDDMDNNIEIRGFDSDNILVNHDSYKYDDKGNETEHLRSNYYECGNVTERFNTGDTIEYLYNEYHDWIKIIEFKYGEAQMILIREFE